MVEEYSQWLGSLLRDSKETHGDQEWFKNLSSQQKPSREQKARRDKANIKGLGSSDAWVTFKDLMLSTNEQGEAEIMFEAVEEINRKIERLEKVRNAIEELKKVGLGENIIYVVYIRDGIPERIVLRSKQDNKLEEKFKFVTELLVSKAL